jgi:hypothetical protein
MGATHGQVRAGFHLLGKLFPATPLESLTSEPYLELVEKYKKLDARGNLLGFVAFAVSTIAIASLLAGLAHMAQRGLPADTRQVLGSGWVEFILWAMFPSIFGTIYLSLKFLRLMLGRQEFAIYVAYGARRMPGNIDTNKAFFWLSVIFIPPIVVLAALYVTSYTAFTDHALIDRPFGSPGTVSTRAYADIRGIYLVRGYHARFQDNEAPFFVIVFNDGSRWETRPGHQGDQLKSEVDLMTFVSEKSGVPISRVSFGEEIPR